MSSLTGLTKVASFPKAAVASTWEYTKQLSMQNLCHTPTLTGGTTSTYYADGFIMITLFPAFVCLPVVATLAMVVMLAWST